jgi:dipeptidase E
MKIYLSSNKIPDTKVFSELVGKPLTEVKLALIPNAKDNYSEKLRSFKLSQAIAYFSSLGIKIVIVDLRDYDNSVILKDALEPYDVIWGYGGNTFCLRYEMKRSGFDEAIRLLVAEGKVYGGESAGAIVASRTLRGTEMADVPEAAEEVVWDGIGLVDMIVVPHADGAQFADYVIKIRDLYKNEDGYVELNDNQALVIDGKSQTIVTEETIIES